MRIMKAIKKTNLVFKILFNVTLFLYGIVVVAGPIMLGNKGAINSFFGITTSIGTGDVKGAMYYETKFNNMAEVKAATKDIIEETMEEGAVLLKNENNALPLSKGDSVNLYGFASYYTVITGQGSGVGNAKADLVTLEQGLTAAGLSVNQPLNDWYKSKPQTDFMTVGARGGTFTGGGTQQSQFTVRDANWSELPDSKSAEARAGIAVFARNSGEAIDLYMDTTMDTETMAGDGNRVIVNRQANNNEEKSHGDSLALTENERSVLEGMKALKAEGKLDSIIVLINAASPLMCDFVNDEAYGIDACMWIGAIGTYGANGIGRLLTGEVNPSGRTADTFWANSKYNPVYYNFGAIEYANSGILKGYQTTLDGEYDDKYYIAYQEGIYNGYKYTETRYEDILTGRDKAGVFDYGKAVTFPFGYGLSYSEFEYSNMKVTENAKNKTYTVTVDVTNTSAVDGKEVVQVYLQKPYTAKDIANGVEKAAVELIGFTKVEVKAGKTVTAEIEVKEKYFAAYDANVEKTYVIGSENQSDKYLLTVAKDAHDAENNILQYKAQNGVTVDTSKIFKNARRSDGDKDMVWGKYIAYNNKTYSTNEFIENENAAFENLEHYEGQKANYGVDKITNQFDDVDFTKAGIFAEGETSQVYTTRSDWAGTCGKRINLTAAQALVEAQKCAAVEKDDVPYPTYGEVGFYEGDELFDEIKLIYLRGKDYNDPLWDTLLDRVTWDEYCYILQEGLRFTNGIESINAPSSSQQNGGLGPVQCRTDSGLPSQSGFRGFSETRDPDNKSKKPATFVCNGIVAATYNKEFIQRLGEQTGEEGIWAGYNGIYGLGVNIHRGAYCGRQFEYYSEDGFLTGMAAGYEAAGAHKMGMFVLAKHGVLNDQETHRAGVNVWANEQSIREIYGRAIEVAVEVDTKLTPKSVLGIMTGMNRMGAKWTGAQGFCNTVLRAEYGMRGYVVSDYNSGRLYCSPQQGVLNGNDLPDGQPASEKNPTDKDGNSLYFSSYSEGYGKFAWAMRDSTKKILYTVVNSNTMNGFTGDTAVKNITPAWETAIPVVTRVMLTVFVWVTVIYCISFVIGAVADSFAKSNSDEE